MSAILGDRFADTSSVKCWDGHGTLKDDRSQYDTLGYSSRSRPAAERRYICMKEQTEIYFLLAVVLAVSKFDLVWRLRPRRHRIFEMLHSWHRPPRLHIVVHNSTVPFTWWSRCSYVWRSSSWAGRCALFRTRTEEPGPSPALSVLII
jgi:hypothetical protein